jgi:hypothetical protein
VIISDYWGDYWRLLGWLLEIIGVIIGELDRIGEVIVEIGQILERLLGGYWTDFGEVIGWLLDSGDWGVIGDIGGLLDS